MGSLRDLMDHHQVLLAEGAILERIRRNPLVPLDPFVADATLINDQKGRLLLNRLHREYIDIAVEFKLPAVIFTSTWRASKERVEAAGLNMMVNQDAATMLLDLRKRYKSWDRNIAVGGLMGPKNDAYKPSTALPADAAYRYHMVQVRILAFSGVDFIMASTLPALTEALGMARALAEVGLPYVLSFVVRGNGTLLDGTLLASAIRKIGDTVRPWPLGIMVNCVHPENFRSALSQMDNTPDVRRQIIGLQANTSRRGPELLDASEELDAGDPAEFAREMAALRRDYGLRILGGCCGTDGAHIRALAGALTKQ